MKYLAKLLSVGIVLAFVLALLCAPSYAEQLNYTSMITTWAQKLHPGQVSSFSVKEVIDLGVENTGVANGELAMWVVLTVADKQENYIIIVGAKGIKASKQFDPNKPPTDSESQSEEGPSCSPEEHEQHHGKDA